MKSPYPYFGGKSAIAKEIWHAFGAADNYIEPFFGSGAVLLSRPDFNPSKPPIETVNDKDGFIANFWRSLKADPDAVTWWADYPVSETDLHARHGWLINRRERLTWSLEDPDFYDAKIAGWWIWGIAQWIGSGWCGGRGPWVSNGVEIAQSGDAGMGINRQIPHLGDAGMGINRQIPHLGDAGMGINRKIPHPGNAGMVLGAYMDALAERMRKVRVCCGDWSRVLGESVTTRHGPTAVFMDPPYGDRAGRKKDLYAEDGGEIADEVAAWCRKNQDKAELRIVLCGYEGEHYLPGWVCEHGQAAGGNGYGGQGNKAGRENTARERIWLSPSCIDQQSMKQEGFSFCSVA